MGKKKKRDKHHLVPRSRGGADLPNNKILIDIEKHRCWHTLFGTLTLDEVIELLQRIKRMKEGKCPRKSVATADESGK